MHVVLPYAGPERYAHPASPLTEVIRAVEATGHQYDMLYCGRSDRDYFDWLTRLWNAGETFAVVEHDIVIHPTALDELENCPRDWCGFPHRYGNTITYGLGCVKFSADLIARNPAAMVRVGVLADMHHPKRHWCRLDAWLQGCVLPDSGEVKHCHETVVGHLGQGCAHGCAPT